MNQNIEMIDEVSILLKELTEKVVFVGGAITSLLITDPAISDVRPTKDVDVIVEVTSYTEYSKLEETLRNKGFKQKISSKDPLCRWIIGTIIVDFMPTDTKILGFSNLWYGDAIKNYTLKKCLVVNKNRNSTLFYQLKLKPGRGENDFIMSHDIEDIILVIDGREEISNEIRKTDPNLRKYIQKRLSKFKEYPQFRDAIAGYLPTDINSQQRFQVIIDRINNICESKGI